MAKPRYASNAKKTSEISSSDMPYIASMFNCPFWTRLYSFDLRTCFFPLIQTRFRKSLEPSINPNPDGPRRKALKAVGSLVIAFSGGTSSTTVLDLVAKSYFAPRSTTNGLGEDTTEEFLKGGKEHPRNTDKGVWKGKTAVCYVEVCGVFPHVRFSLCGPLVF